MTPDEAFAASIAPDLRADSGWLYRGQDFGDAADPLVFYVHPTTAPGPSWFADPDAPDVDESTRRVTDAHLDAFPGRVWAPRYRQATTRAFHKRSSGGADAYDLAYRDVASAFTAFLADDAARPGPRRPIVLAGHSQGALAGIRVSARSRGGVVEVRPVEDGALDAFTLAGGNLHHVDVDLFAGNLRADVRRRTAHWHRWAETRSVAGQPEPARTVPAWPGARGRRVRVGNAWVHHVDLGPADGDVVVLLHKLGGWAADWRHAAELIAARHRVLVVDVPGHGGRSSTANRRGRTRRGSAPAGSAHSCPTSGSRRSTTPDRFRIRNDRVTLQGCGNGSPR